MDPKRALVRHFLATIAYRTQKALRGTPDGFADFRAAVNVRTPHELVWHMVGVLGHARTFFIGGVWQPERVPFRNDVQRFHDVLQDLDRLLDSEAVLNGLSLEQLLQGPLADAMTHAGQLAMLRRVCRESPVKGDKMP